MKICAMTMVYKDYWALSQWYEHHGRQIGCQNLFVVSHGADDQISKICPEAHITTIPRDDLQGFDRKRGLLLDAFQDSLLKDYDWVIRTDADELICAENGLHDLLLENSNAPVLFAVGFDLVEQYGDSSLVGQSVFKSRKSVAFSGHYSKAVAFQRPLPLKLHGVSVPLEELEKFPFSMPRGLFLAHLKYANFDVLEEATKVRSTVANGFGPGLPGAGWKNAEEDAEKFLMAFVSKRPRPWDVAEQKAYRRLSIKPNREPRQSLVKTRALKFDFRTELPVWFANQ